MNNSEYTPPLTYEQTPALPLGERELVPAAVDSATARAFSEAIFSSQSIYDQTEVIPGLEPRIRPLTLEQLRQAKVNDIARQTIKMAGMRQDELALAA